MTQPSSPSTGAPLELYDSLSRSLVRFQPIQPDLVKLYSCGPTVYHYAHLGNLRAYLFTDTLRRVLNWKGWPTNHVINITDVGHLTSDADSGEDKMERAASGSGRDIWQVAAFYTDAFKNDLARLNVLPPTLWSVATAHVQDMIGFAQTIAAHGATYELPTGLYFDTSKVPDYGRLARATTDEGESRIDPVDGKRNLADFALWRRTPAGTSRQMEWTSPWGPGAPGWHLECSVMSLKYLGPRFDIHTGGIDHREIHHPNEIAQNQAFHQCADTGAAIWMHNNFLVDRAGKMSKSSGETLTLQWLVDRGVHPLAYRLLCLGAHYRSELEFSAETVLASLTRLKRLVLAVAALRATARPVTWLRTLAEATDSRGAALDWQREVLEAGLGPDASEWLHRFDEAISADLMTPRALPLLEELVATRSLSADDRLRLVASMDLVLGLGLIELDRTALRVRPAMASLSAEEVEARIAARREARGRRDFARSDQLRDELLATGIEVMDGDPLGWDWRSTLA